MGRLERDQRVERRRGIQSKLSCCLLGAQEERRRVVEVPLAAVPLQVRRGHQPVLGAWGGEEVAVSGGLERLGACCSGDSAHRCPQGAHCLAARSVASADSVVERTLEQCIGADRRERDAGVDLELVDEVVWSLQPEIRDAIEVDVAAVS